MIDRIAKDDTIFDPKFLERLGNLLNNKQSDFAGLAHIAGLNPRHDFKEVELVNIDFGFADIRRFDFSGAKLIQCNFSSASIESRNLKGSIVDGSIFNVTQFVSVAKYCKSMKNVTIFRIEDQELQEVLNYIYHRPDYIQDFAPDVKEELLSALMRGISEGKLNEMTRREREKFTAIWDLIQGNLDRQIQLKFSPSRRIIPRKLFSKLRHDN